MSWPNDMGPTRLELREMYEHIDRMNKELLAGNPEGACVAKDRSKMTDPNERLLRAAEELRERMIDIAGHTGGVPSEHTLKGWIERTLHYPELLAVVKAARRHRVHFDIYEALAALDAKQEE